MPSLFKFIQFDCIALVQFWLYICFHLIVMVADQTPALKGCLKRISIRLFVLPHHLYHVQFIQRKLAGLAFREISKSCIEKDIVFLLQYFIVIVWTPNIRQYKVDNLYPGLCMRPMSDFWWKRPRIRKLTQTTVVVMITRYTK